MQVLGRIFIIDDQVDSLEVYVHELVPLNGERSGWEKVTEYFSHFDVGTWRELLEVPGEEPFQALFKGEFMTDFITGRDRFYANVTMTQPVPADWLDGSTVIEGGK